MAKETKTNSRSSNDTDEPAACGRLSSRLDNTSKDGVNHEKSSKKNGGSNHQLLIRQSL